MEEDIQFIIDTAKEQMENAIRHLEHEFTNLRAGKASPIMLQNVKVNYYGASTPLSQVANINTMDAHTLAVQPWEKSMINEIEKGIMSANLGFNPMNNGEYVIIHVPPLTEERRRDLVKQAKSLAEYTKVGIRNDRKEANSDLKKLESSEDLLKNAEEDVQVLTDKFIKQVDSHLSIKEEEIMKV
jgi:ribosome recycling factor